MKEKVTGGHGLAGVNTLVDMACKNQKKGTCDGEILHSGTVEQTFGRLVSRTPSNKQPSKDQLRQLAESMLENESTASDGVAEAGMAFLGQFIDHDITLDATTELGKAAGDVTKIRNFRTPQLDLDCVYGDGPEVSNYLYDDQLKLIFGRRKGDVDQPAGSDDLGENPLDLQRNRRGTALIGDPRNDENLFLSQVQGRIFIERHNACMDQAKGNAEEKYEHAKAELTHWYHRTIVEEFLPQVVADSILQPLIYDAKRGYLSDLGKISWDTAPDMPVEFSAAAYRFGHSMIRQRYDLNGNEGRNDVSIFPDPNNENPVQINGFSVVAEENNLDFDRFFGSTAQRARPIDTNIPAALLKLPEAVVGDGEANLALRNMDRGQLTFDLPSGERMAEYMGFDPIDSDKRVVEAGLSGNTPLWYYILSEAEHHSGKLGPVGGSLVAGVLLNLMLKGNSPLFPVVHS